MAAPRKYPDELRERATRMAVEARRDPATRTAAWKELRRANAILKSASAFFASVPGLHSTRYGTNRGQHR
jgi:transposase-like protein